MLTRKRQKPQHPTDDKRWRIVDTRMRQNGNASHGLIEALHSAQEAFGYLDDDALAYVARSLHVPLSKVYGVATFYHYFTLKPKGEHTCVVCLGTACYIKGAGDLLDEFEQRYHIKPEETTADNKLSLLTARCLGACGLAPAVVMDEEVMGNVSVTDLNETLARMDVQG